ncbi:hypothetical protein KCU65_g6638, partial [Aureobasidium melanogenum]
MTARQPDPIPHWQVVAGGYESPTEENFEEIRQVYSLADWVSEHAEEAIRLLGKKNTRLKQPEVRLQIWPVNVRHTNFQLRAIWKYCNERCWQLAPYAFNSDLRPYAEFSWVVYPTKARFSGNKTTPTIAVRPAPATSVFNNIKHTQSLDNRHSGPPVAQKVSTPGVNRVQLQPNAPRGPINCTKRTASQAAHTSGSHPFTPNGVSQNLGKVPVRSAQAPLGSPSQPPRPADSRTSSTAPASASKSRHAPELAHPPQKPSLDHTSTLNAAAQNQSSAEALHHRDRTRSFEAHAHPEPTTQLKPSQIKKEAQIQSSLLQDSGRSSQHEATQGKIPYSPTPGPSSNSTRPRIEPLSEVRSPYRDGAKTPGPSNGKNAAGSVELGTPRLRSTHKHLPSTAAQEPVAAQHSRAEGKQPSRAATSSAGVPSPEVGKQSCKTLETPIKARQTDATAPLASGTAASSRSAEMPNNEIEPCKHRQKGQECMKCGYGCCKCHRPGIICPKQRAEARAGKRKADDPDVKVEESDNQTQLSSLPKNKKARVQESVDPVVKVEEPPSHVQLGLVPKKKQKKNRTRDSVGEWYDPIEISGEDQEVC